MTIKTIRTITDLRSVRYSAMLAGVAALAFIAAACPGGDDGADSEQPEPMEPDMMTMMPEPMPPMEPMAAEPPAVTAALSASRINEGGSSTLTLTADAALEQAVQFTLSAEEGITFGDGEQSDATLTIAAGERAASIAVNAPRIEDDATPQIQGAVNVSAPSGAEIEFTAAALPLVYANIIPVAVTADISPQAIPEEGMATLTITASAPVAETVTFMISPESGVSIDSGRRALQIPAGQSSAAIGVIGGQIRRSTMDSASIIINVSADSPAVDFSSVILSVLVENSVDLTLAEPVLNGNMVTLMLEAGYASPRLITAEVQLPASVFARNTATIRIPSSSTSGRVTLMVENAPESGRTVEFNLGPGSITGIDNFNLETPRQTLTFP